MKKYIWLHVALMGFIGVTTAQQKEDYGLPEDLSVRYGSLPNGMRYYVKHNEEPKDRASFYFAQKVGSILESDSQQGLAHFLEHMAFNGLEHFKGKEMITYLEKNGLSFGREINASTNFDKTVYNIDNVPVVNAQLLDSVLLVLHDWSGSISLEEKEIDAERGVINEEARTRNNAPYRVMVKVLSEGTLRDTRYAKRMPIGKMSVVNNFKYSELRDYYKRWYRPDLQGVVVVGDIDIDQMEQKIKNMFSDIPLREGLPPKPSITYANPKEKFVFLKATDKELGTPSVGYDFSSKSEQLKGVAEIRKRIVQRLSMAILNKRFEEYAHDPKSAIFRANFYNASSVSPIDIYELSILPKDSDQLLEAFEFALTELERYQKYGATDAELDREKSALGSFYAATIKNLEKTPNNFYVHRLVRQFLENRKPFTDMEWELNFMINYLDSVANKDVVDFMRQACNEDGQTLYVSGSNTYTYPGKEDFLNIIDKVATKKLEPFEEEVDDRPLIAEKLEEKNIKKTFDVARFPKAKGYILNNDVKIIVYPTDYDKDRIFMSGNSRGGYSLLDASKLPSAQVASSVAGRSGLGPFKETELAKKLSGKNASVSLNINPLSESVSGFSTKTDIETMFKLLYLSFTAPRFDQDRFDQLTLSARKHLIAKQNNTKSRFYDSLTMANTNHNKRTILFTKETINKRSLEKCKEIYTDRFKNIADFEFVFVGDIDKEELLRLANTYIANIPSLSEREDYVDHHIQRAKGKTLVHMSQKMETPEATIRISYETGYPFSKNNQLTLNMASDLLKKRYKETIREEEGGSYGVSVYSTLSKDPVEKAALNVRFNCNPDKVEKLKQIVYHEIQNMTKEVDDDDLQKVKKSYIKSIKEQINENDYWMSQLVDQEFNDVAHVPVDEYIQMVNAVTEKDIEKMMKKITKKGDIVEGVLMPEE